MSVLLDIKNEVAGQLGADNGSVSVPKRDRAINRARRKYYSEKRWSYLKKTASITITAQLGSVPSDFNKKFDPIAVYTYSGNMKYEYKKVDWDDLLEYGTLDYCYAINKVNGQIKISQTTVTPVSMDYTYLPADAAISTADDNTTEPAPDITAIVLLSIGIWWLSSERATGKYQLFYDQYKDQLTQDIRIDGASQALRRFNRPCYPDFGYKGRR